MTQSPQGEGAHAPVDDDNPWKHYESIERPGDMDTWIILRHRQEKTFVLYENKKSEPIIVKRQKSGDYYCHENGLGYLRNGTIVNTRIQEVVSPDDWPEPADITSSVSSVPYPVEAVPPVAKAAVLEYQAIGQQPMSMVASSMLAHMALAVQPHADVARNDYLCSPTSLYCLIQADSGERKTAVDKTFGKVFRDWQAKVSIPEQSGHPFRPKAATESGAKRPGIPGRSGQGVRGATREVNC